ncbi:hypothetical protein [Escherichia coli]|uniref:hypothetical protein n=1 Tax=Escherichia coli TaxID=562 RepID=UPI0030F492F0
MARIFFVLFIVLFSVRAYSDDVNYCELIWEPVSVDVTNVKQLSDTNYQLTLKTSSSMRLLDYATNMKISGKYTVSGYVGYWTSFLKDNTKFNSNYYYNINKFAENNSPGTIHGHATYTGSWDNGCVGSWAKKGYIMDWGQSTTVTVNLTFSEKLTPGNYSFAGTTLPLTILYEERKGEYSGSQAMLVNSMKEKGNHTYITNSPSFTVSAAFCTYSDVDINFGEFSTKQAKSGVNVSTNISLNCQDKPNSVTLKLLDINRLNFDVSAPLPVSCNAKNGVNNCKLYFTASKSQLNIGSQFFTKDNVTFNIPLYATYQSDDPVAGTFSDSAILEISVQ